MVRRHPPDPATTRLTDGPDGCALRAARVCRARNGDDPADDQDRQNEQEERCHHQLRLRVHAWTVNHAQRDRLREPAASQPKGSDRVRRPLPVENPRVYALSAPRALGHRANERLIRQVPGLPAVVGKRQRNDPVAATAVAAQFGSSPLVLGQASIVTEVTRLVGALTNADLKVGGCVSVPEHTHTLPWSPHRSPSADICEILLVSTCQLTLQAHPEFAQTEATSRPTVLSVMRKSCANCTQ